MDSNTNSAFQEALQRARQLAAKMTTSSSQNSSQGSKRFNDDDDDDDYGGRGTKRGNFDEIGSALSAAKSQSRPARNQLYLEGIVSNGEKTLDFMIPGKKVGFVIGKGGEMIRTLQDKAGVRMVIFQDSTQSSEQDKQLRITGPPDQVDHAKQLVQDLLLEKEMESGRMRGGRGGDMPRMNSGMNEYGSGSGSSRITFFEYPVAPQLIGLVIGKGGDTIRKIQGESGCKVQFDTAKLDAQGNKICQFTGTQDAINKAVDMVKEIVETITGGGGQGGVEEIRLAVPASRTGTVIGRGGETIRQLKQQSGCNIELDKSYHSDNDEKCFILRGTADKLSYAQQLITDKVGSNVTVISSTLPQFNDNPYGYLSGQIYANQVRQPGSGPPSASVPSDQYGDWSQQSADGNNKPGASTQDQYAMWAAYYAQYYSQQPQGTNGSGGSNSAGQEQYPSQQAQDTSHYDETVYQQWIDYYKAYGMTKEVEAMEKSLREYKNSKKNGEQSKNSGGGSNGSSRRNSHHNGDSN